MRGHDWQKVGISRDSVSTSDHADLVSFMSGVELSRIKRRVQRQVRQPACFNSGIKKKSKTHIWIQRSINTQNITVVLILDLNYS